MDNRVPRRRRALGVALILAALSVVVSALSPHRAAAAGATLTVTPNSGVIDGQFVKLDLSGFPPQSGVPFRECIANPVNVATDCSSINVLVSAITDSTGASETYLPVYDQASSRPASSGYSSFPIVCNQTHACVVAAVTTATDLTGAVYAPLSLAPSTADCPNPGARAVFGTGGATAYRAIFAWQAAVCGPPNNLPVVYAVSNGIDGVNNFGVGQTQANFGVTGPIPPFTLPSTAPSFKMAPVTGSGVVLAYRMYDRRGPQITNLLLTPWLISQIFLGNIGDFDVNADIKYLNPGIEFPGVTQPYVRAEHSSETYAFTSWLNATLGKGSWPAGVQTVFPPKAGVLSISGSQRLGAAVANPITDWSTFGNIGFMDASTAAYYGLPTVRIRMDNLAIVQATPSTIAQGLAASTANADGSYTPPYAAADPGVWPMSVVSSMLVPTDQISVDNGKTLSAFLRYAVQQGQTNLPAGYVPLPALMVNQAMTDAGLIPQTEPAASSSTGADTLSSGGGFDASASTFGGGGVPLGSLRGIAGPTTQQTSPSPGASRCSSGASACAATSPGASATPSGLASLLVADSGTRFLFVAILALTSLGLVAGPLTYVLARRPDLRARLERLSRWRPFGRTAP